MLSLFGAELYDNEPEKYRDYCSKVEDYAKLKAGEVEMLAETLCLDVLHGIDYSMLVIQVCDLSIWLAKLVGKI